MKSNEATPIKKKKRISVSGATGSLSLLLMLASTMQAAAAAAAVAWQPVPNILLSKFAKDVDPKAPLPAYDATHAAMLPLINNGLSAAICACLTDLESGPDGFLTYDREVMKMPVESMRKSHEALKH
ncbi:MAG: hypothetical protein NTW21_30745 [Verrucomicrobia bacterium]|nr:hypothetical protein [Verrucomicrobiota bacterium]